MRINKTKLYNQYFIKKIFCKTGISNFNYKKASFGRAFHPCDALRHGQAVRPAYLKRRA